MAEASQWNRPKKDANGAQGTRHKAPGTSYANRRGRPFARGLLAALIVIIGGGLAFYFICGQSETPVPTAPKEKKRGKIAEVEPAKVTNKVVSKKESQQEEWKRKGFPKNPWGSKIPKDLEYKPHWLYTEEDYARIDPTYAARHENFKKRSAANPWKTNSDGQLSVLLFSDPSQPNLLLPFDQHFVKQFKESLKKPIEIDPEKDSPELQEQKRVMIAMRDMLKKEMDQGNDITKILEEERSIQLELRGLRQNLERELHEIEKTATSEQEVKDYIEAANKMLEARGVTSKIKMSLMPTRWRLMREAEQNGTQEY